MKIISRLVCMMLLFYAGNVKAQVKIDTTNLISQLTGLENSTGVDARKFYTDRKYVLIASPVVDKTDYKMWFYYYRLPGQQDGYTLAVINGGVMTAGYITTSAEASKSLIGKIIAVGFVASATADPDPTKTNYFKDGYKMVVQVTQDRGKTAYVFALMNPKRTALVMAGRASE